MMSEKDIDFGFIAVEKDDIESVIELTGFELDGNKVLKDGEEVYCHSCDKRITKDNLGTIAPPKYDRIVFCDSPICTTDYAVNYLEEEQKECPKCNGDGKYTRPYFTYGHMTVEEVECDLCEGKGTVDPETKREYKEKKTSRRVRRHELASKSIGGLKR